jgi:4'-phosphopantetheinyl transferase
MTEIAIAAGQVHLWSARLDLPSQTLDDCLHVVSADERERAARFHFEEHRRRFVAARALLRIILGAYVKVPPHRIRFAYSPNGKPALPGDAVHFNASHSEERAVFAIAADTPIGVDLERVRPLPDLDQIADRFFSAPESAALAALAPSHRTEAFFRCWTRKEAFVKALGDGLSYPLDRFAVSLAEAAAVDSVEGDSAKARQWSMYSLSPAEGYVAAVAIRARDCTLQSFHFRVEDAPLGAGV